MNNRRGYRRCCLAALLPSLLAVGCVVVGPGGGNENVNDNSSANDNDNGNTGGVGGLQIGFADDTQQAGRFASAIDDQGNEYTFFTTPSDGGDVILTEVNILDTEGMTAKVTLDDQGRPISLLGGDGTRANILYTGNNTAKIALAESDSDGGDDVIEGVEVPSDSSTARKINRTYRLQDDDDLDFLGVTLDVFDDFAFSFFAGESDPLYDTGLREPTLQIASLVEVLNVSVNVNVTTIEEVHDVIIIEEVPEAIELLDGTWVLCSRDGIPANQLGIENELTFGSGVRADFLALEFDRQNVFDLTNLFTGGPSAGVEIDYLNRFTVGPQQIDANLDLFLTPLYSATSQDLFDNIVVDRRFLVETVGTLGDIPLNTSYQINAALINGRLDASATVLTFDLVVIDLQNDLAFDAPVQLTYVRAGACTGSIPGNNRLAVICPGYALELNEAAEVAVDVPDDFSSFSVSWYLLDGYGFFTDPNSPVTEVVALDTSLPLRVAVSVVDVTGKYADGECSIAVIDYIGSGDVCFDAGYYDDGICDSFCPLPDPDCSFGVDICFENGYYNDGICDAFCFEPDPDCDLSSGDYCAENGWYGDGICDDCPLTDPDCEGGSDDYCEANGYYGDGICDDFCPEPDPDCFGGSGDFCFDNDYYGDGTCDDFCPEPDPDCFDESDYCAENGYYGDGFCDDCPLEDPDCFDDGGGEEDFCEANDYYGDGICDDFCPEPDPDCFEESDECLENGYYNDGICDDFCPEPDPDCFDDGSEEDDFCEENGYYGDGICDDCPLPDPDCF